MQRAKRPNKKGTTLVEVLFSAMILAVAVTGILFIFVQTIDMSRRVDYEYTATNLARARMERARSVIETNGLDSLPDLNETDTLIDATGAPDAAGDFKRTTTVATLGSGILSLEFEVEVVYKYRGNWKDSASVTLTTIFSTIR